MGDHERRSMWSCRSVQPAQTTSLRIFISYRQKQTWGHCKLLCSRLRQVFGHEGVFFDTEVLRPGETFPDRIQSELARADVVLLVIGNMWTTLPGAGGGRRIDDPDDWVRREIEMARQFNLRLVPVLVQGATMPAPEDLPEPLRWISYRQGVVIHDGDHWDDGVERLVERLDKPRPRNRFAPLRELRDLASVPLLIRNALAKPCAIGLGLMVAMIGLWGEPWLAGVGALSYMLLSATTFFTLSEAEWVSSMSARAADAGSG